MKKDHIWIDKNGTAHRGQKDEDGTLAYKSQNFYFILVSRDGDVFNPLNTSLNINKIDKNRGGRYFILEKCCKDCYEYYVQFLKSKNYTHYLLAQRRFLNGQ